MPIDPVVLLAEDIRACDMALVRAARVYGQHGRSDDGEAVRALLLRMRGLFCVLCETAPTSALGAAEMLDVAACRLSDRYAVWIEDLRGIAGRLADGVREHSDLVRLRIFQAALRKGVELQDGEALVSLLEMAIRGAARPVLVYRAVHAVQGRPQAVLSTRSV